MSTITITAPARGAVLTTTFGTGIALGPGESRSGLPAYFAEVAVQNGCNITHDSGEAPPVETPEERAAEVREAVKAVLDRNRPADLANGIPTRPAVEAVFGRDVQPAEIVAAMDSLAEEAAAAKAKADDRAAEERAAKAQAKAADELKKAAGKGSGDKGK